MGSNPTPSASFRHETPDCLTVTTQYLPPCWPECPRIVHELFCWNENTIQAASFNYEGTVGKKRCWCDHLERWNRFAGVCRWCAKIELRHPQFNFMPLPPFTTEMPEDLRRQSVEAVDRLLRRSPTTVTLSLLEQLPHGLAAGRQPSSAPLQPRPGPWLSVANRRIGAGQARRYFRGSRL